MKRRSLPPTPSSNVYRDTSKLVPADYDYAKDPVLWSPAYVVKSQTRKRCPNGHRRNPDTKECDKKLKSKKISSSLQSEMSMPELEDITMMKSQSVRSLSPVHVKSMSLFSQGNSPMTQNTRSQSNQHYSETPVSIKNEMVSSLPSLFQPSSPDYPPPSLLPQNNEIYVKGVDYYKTQMEKKHLCKINAKTGNTKYPIGKKDACVGLSDGYYDEFVMVYFLKNVYDKIPNNVSKEQLVEIFINNMNSFIQNYYPTNTNFLDIKIIEGWMFTDKQLENKFSTVGKNKPLKTKKDKTEFIRLVRKGVKDIFDSKY